MLQIITKAISSVLPPGIDPKIVKVSLSKEDKNGDYSSNVALVMSSLLKRDAFQLAREMVSKLRLPKGCFEKVEAKAPGYINFYLSREHLGKKIREINNKKERYGNVVRKKKIKVNNEFISANPTGPLHLGNGRGGFYGDVLSNVLTKAGYNVVKEYYVNDAGEQIVKLGRSIVSEANEFYAGEYVEKLRKRLKDARSPEQAGEKAAAIILKEIIEPTLTQELKINFDSWISEKDLHKKGFVDKAVKILRRKKLTFEKDGALWLRTTKFGDDKDRVLIKQNGVKTYFASDCGYLLHKIQRRFDILLEIWGADHHGYIKRFEAAARALGFRGKLKFVIVQLVRLLENGKEVRMSKRAGNVIYIDELVNQVGLDAARFFFLMYSPQAHMNFNLTLAKERSQKNPVYYAQYAHARMSSILAKDEARKMMSHKLGVNLPQLATEKEVSLMRELNKFPDLIAEISESYEVHKLPQFVLRLADKFHDFYESCRVIDQNNVELSRARLMLVNAVRIVLAEALRLMGINAPEKM